MSPVGSTRRFWETRAALLAFRLNVAAWLERLGPMLFAVTSLGAVVVYALRRQRGPVEWGWSGLALAALLTAIVMLWLARRRFFSSAEARVLIESQLRLDTRLTAASIGLVPWPDVPESLPSVVQWRLRGPAGWFSSAAIMLALAACLPVADLTAIARGGEKPPALAQTEAMLEALAQAKVAESAAVEQMAERARELANRPAEQQYSHSALEAADALRDQTAAAVSALSRNLEAASNALQSAENEPSSKAAAGRLSAALTGLREGALPANAELLKQLGADASALDKLSPEQLKALANALAEASQRAKGVLGANGSGAPVARPDMDGKGPGSRSGFGGPGGKGGGESSAPLALANQASDAGDGKSEAFSAASLANLALGDKLGTTSGAHEVDPTKAAGPTSAGAIAAPAKGGEAVWVNRLTPAERAALKNFYK
ncbi:MAG TPA: hypothetical protein VHO24_10495 [Opitutaceae bacterium]|nr:hypothetical protein [Opitutaceae bacterium]